MSKLHYEILRYVIKNGYAPEVPDLSRIFNASEAKVVEGLLQLQEYHGVVLHPSEPKIWVIHPFSLAPANFWVKSEKGEWWGNCAWCSLGIAALLQEDVTIISSFGAHGDRVEINIKEGAIQEKDLYIHFPIPMKKAWDNVIYTCSTMLVFKDKAQIEVWSERHNIPVGDIQPLSTVWEFSKRWYGNHLNANWKKWTVQQAKAIFEEFGFHHEIWNLEPSKDRF